MSILTKNALSASNQASFPDNTSGAITPLILRDYNQSVIDTLVDSLNTGSFAITTGSNDFTQANSFTSISASSFVSASAFIGDGSKITGITASVAIPISDEGILQGYATQLNFSGSNISASLNAGIATISVNTNNLITTSSFNSYTASINAFTSSQETKNTTLANVTASLNAYTSSNNTKWSNLGTQSGSWVTESESGSFLITASVNLNTLTFTKGDNTTFAVTVNTGSAQTTDITSLNAFTASQDTKNIAVQSSTSSLNSATASLFTSASLSLTTASVSLNTITFRKGDGTTFAITVNTGSATSTDISALNSFTSSQLTINSAIGASTSSLNTFSSSVLTQLSTLANVTSSLISKTGSYATTGSNTFVGNQTITGNITAFSASFTYLQTIYESSSVIYSSGSNQFGDELTDIQTLSGSVKVQGSLTVNGTPVQTSSVSITALNSFTASQETKDNTLATYTASVDTKFTVVGASTSSLNSATASLFTSASLGLTTASVSVNVITFRKGDGTTFDIAVASSGSVTPGTISGSQQITSLGFVSSSVTASSLVTASFDTGTRNLTFTKGNTTQFSVNIPDVSGSGVPTGTVSSSAQILGYNVFATTGSNTFNGNQTINGNVNLTGSLTASGLFYPTTAGTAGQFMTTNGTNTLSFDDVHVLLEDVRYGESITLGDPLYVSGSNGTRPVVYKADASNSAKMPVIYVANSTAVANTNTTAITLGLITGVTTTGYPEGTTIYVAEGTAGWSASRPSGSNSIVQSLGIVTKTGAGGSGRGLVLNPGPATLPNLQTGYAWVGNGGNQPVAVLTSSFAENTNLTSLNAFTASQDTKNTTLASTTASLFTSASIALYTASVNLNTITFTKGDKTTFNITVNTGSAITTDISSLNAFTASQYIINTAIGASTSSLNTFTSSANTQLTNLSTSQSIDNTKWNTLGGQTGSFATTGSNSFAGNQTIQSGFELITPAIQSSTSAGLVVSSSANLGIARFGAGGGQQTEFFGQVTAVGAMSASSFTGLGNLTTYSTSVDTRLVAEEASSSVFATKFATIGGQSGSWGGGSSIPTGTVSSSAQILNYGIFATTGSNSFIGNQTITGVLSISSSATYDLDITGAFQATAASRISGSTGINTLTQTTSQVSASAGIALMGRGYSAFTINQNQIGLYASGSGIAGPNAAAPIGTSGIAVSSGSNFDYYYPITFQTGPGYIDGTISVRTPLSASAGFTASLQNGYAWVGNSLGQNTQVATSSFATNTSNLATTGSNSFVGNQTITGSLILSSSAAVELQVIGNMVVTGSAIGNVVSMSINSNTASMDFNLGNYFELTASVSPVRIEVTNLSGGVTSTLAMNGVTASTINWSSNVLQPSGSAYTASVSGSNDILSFVAFNSSKVNVVSTLKMI